MADTQSLGIPDVGSIRQDLGLPEPTEKNAVVRIDNSTESALDREADGFVDRLLELRTDDVEAQESIKASIDNIGLNAQRKSAQRSQMLQQPVKKLMERSEDGGPVAKSLIELQMHVEDLDPSGIDFGEAGWFGRMLGKVPGVGKSLKRYFARYQAADTVIAAIMKSLKDGQSQLKRDNGQLGMDQKSMREATGVLEKAVRVGQLIDDKLTYKMDREVSEEDPRKEFIENELLFPLRQRIMDLQQQLTVNQQGFVALEIIIRNNRELIRGVDRAMNVTISALRVGVTVAMALANQKIVMAKLEAINRTTSDLIAGTAARLKTQGTETHKQASGAMLEMDKLKQAWSDVKAAMDDISSYRKEALPKMAQTILDFDAMTQEGEEAIQRIEQGNRAAPAIMLETEE